MKKTLTIILMGCLFLSKSQAQQLLGIANSNYAGTNGISLNPSSIADSRYGFYMNLGTFNTHFMNNYAGYNAPFSPMKYLTDRVDKQYETEEGNVVFKSDYVKERLNGRAKMATLGGEVRGPSFMIKLDQKRSVALSTRVRAGFQVNNASEELVKLLRSGIDDADLFNKINTNNQFSLNANAFSEVGVTYAQTILATDKHFLKAGITIKRLSGIYSSHIINKGASYRIIKDPQDASQEALEIQNIDLNFGYLEQQVVDDYSFGKGAGSGWGADLGFTYEHRPDMSTYTSKMDGEDYIDNKKNKYDYRIGFGLIDLGGIRYNNQQYVRNYTVQKTNKILRPQAFENVEGSDDAVAVIEDALDVQPSDRQTSFKSGLPTAFNFTFDYKVINRVYVNATLIHSLRGKHAIAMRQNSVFAVTPRLEMKWLEVSFPISMMNNYSTLALGSMLRLGPLVVGSDNIGGLLNIGTPYGADIYAGISIPLFKANKRDKDKDGVSDRKDKCKKEPGTWENQGCPDKPLNLK